MAAMGACLYDAGDEKAKRLFFTRLRLLPAEPLPYSFFFFAGGFGTGGPSHMTQSSASRKAASSAPPARDIPFAPG